MTLIIYAKCKDASIIVCDRQEGSGTSNANEVTKHYIPNDASYIMAFSASKGPEIDRFYTQLKIKQIQISQITIGLNDVVKSIGRLAVSQDGEDGCMILNDSLKIVFYRLTLFSNDIVVLEDNVDWRCIGDENAVSVGNVLMGKVKVFEDIWQKATQKIIAIMKEIAKRNSSVGQISLFGFDVFVMKNSGEIFHKKYTNDVKPDLIVKIDEEDPMAFNDLFKQWGA